MLSLKYLFVIFECSAPLAPCYNRFQCFYFKYKRTISVLVDVIHRAEFSRFTMLFSARITLPLEQDSHCWANTNEEVLHSKVHFPETLKQNTSGKSHSITIWSQIVCCNVLTQFTRTILVSNQGHQTASFGKYLFGGE